MRIVILALMIALLPLRGWAGEVMATEIASAEVIRTHQEAQSTINLVAASADIYSVKATLGHQQAKSAETLPMHDCEGHAKADETVSADTHCDSCPACQACHALGLSTAAVSLNSTFFSSPLPRRAADHFASAIAALGQKPPIS